MKNNTNIESREEMEKRFDENFPKGKKGKPEYVHSDTDNSYAFLMARKEEVGWQMFSAREDIKSFITTTRLSDIDVLRGEMSKLEQFEDNEFGIRMVSRDAVLTLLDQYKDKIK